MKNKDQNQKSKNAKMPRERTSEKIMKILIKESFTEHTATSLSERIGITRQGIWKTLNRLSNEKMIYLKSIADTKKSVVKIELEFKNLLTSKKLSFLLTEESLNYRKWRAVFTELEKCSNFIILFGSILYNPTEANDIDIFIVADRNNFKDIDEINNRIQITQIKKIHFIDLTNKEFKEELKKRNKAYIDALKKGVILFGQDNFVKFMEELKQ